MAGKITAAWFAPKGFASIFYTLVIWRSRIPDIVLLFQVLTLTIVASIIAHSSTDIFFTRWFQKQKDS